MRWPAQGQPEAGKDPGDRAQGPAALATPLGGPGSGRRSERQLRWSHQGSGDMDTWPSLLCQEGRRRVQTEKGVTGQRGGRWHARSTLCADHAGWGRGGAEWGDASGRESHDPAGLRAPLPTSRPVPGVRTPSARLACSHVGDVRPL